MLTLFNYIICIKVFHRKKKWTLKSSQWNFSCLSQMSLCCNASWEWKISKAVFWITKAQQRLAAHTPCRSGPLQEIQSPQTNYQNNHQVGAGDVAHELHSFPIAHEVLGFDPQHYFNQKSHSTPIFSVPRREDRKTTISRSSLST